MKKTKEQKDILWKEFKDSDAFTLLVKLSPYDQQEICFKAGIEKVIEDRGVYLSEEEWEKIKKRLI